MKVLSPTKAIDRDTTARVSFTNELTPSGTIGVDDPPIWLPWRCARAHRTGRVKLAPISAGSTSRGVQHRPATPTVLPTSTGARAKPMLPPVENHAIEVWLPSLAIRARRADSGW